MNKYLCGLQTSLLAAAALCGAETLPLENSGFENGTKGWAKQEWSTGKTQGFEIAAETAKVHSGQKALRMKYVSGGDNLLVNPAKLIPVKEKTEYNISFWSCSEKDSKVQLTVDFLTADNKRAGKQQHAVFDNSTKYQKHEADILAPQGAVKMRFFLRCRKVTTYFDDVEIKTVEQSQGASSNLLKNPGFEEGFKHWGKAEWSGKKGRINFIADKIGPRNGESCAKIQWVSGGDNILIGQKVRIRDNKNFMLSFWAKSAVEPSHNAQAQATARFLDANDKEVGIPQHKIFTTSDVYNEFRWSFTAPENAVSMFIYLRCRKTTTFFDDVSLIESKGVYLRSSFVWLPENQLILNVFNALPSKKNAKLTVELYDRNNKQLLNTQINAPYGADQAIPVELPKLTAAIYQVKVYPAGEPQNSVIDQVKYPDCNVTWPAPYDKLKVRNNFVTELAIAQKPIKIAKGKSIEFPNPRRGWVFFAITPESDGVLQMPGKRQVKLQLKKGVPVESMQLVEPGMHKVTALNDVKLADYTITTMAEVFVDEYESEPGRRKFTNGLMDSYAMKQFIRNANVMQERFPNHNVLELDEIPASERERIAAWRASGKYTITTVTRTGLTSRWKVHPKDTVKFWSTRVGMRELDGLGLDEFGSERPDEAPYFAPAVREITRLFPGKLIVAYTCAAWYSHTQTIDLRAALVEGNHAYAPEQYLREQATEGAAKTYINDFFSYARLWEQAYPGAIKNALWCYGSCDGYPAYYGLDCFASCDQKYFLDMQFAVLVNDPTFFGQRGVIPWIIRYTRPDTLLWQAKLIRHYLIEGKRTMLSKEYGFKFNAGHLIDGDCAEGIKHWQVQPAAPGSIISRTIKDYGFSRGTRNTTPAGDVVIELKRVPGKVNKISQKLRNLKVGKVYEVSLRSADGNDVNKDTPEMKIMALRMTVKGAEILRDKSIIHIYPVVPNNTKGRKKGIVGNHYNLVFKATAPEAELVISDEIPDIKARTFHGQDFAPASEKQQSVIFNFVQVTELLDESWSK